MKLHFECNTDPAWASSVHPVWRYVNGKSEFQGFRLENGECISIDDARARGLKKITAKGRVWSWEE